VECRQKRDEEDAIAADAPELAAQECRRRASSSACRALAFMPLPATSESTSAGFEWRGVTRGNVLPLEARTLEFAYVKSGPYCFIVVAPSKIKPPLPIE
jgi:hypothetical protein